MDALYSSLPFNKTPPTKLHIDLNSCFATAEQQANPLLRGRPLAVAAYTTPSGCIVAPSIEAKRFGVKVGMRVKDGQQLCPGLLILPPEPDKYRHINRQLYQVLSSYTDKIVAISIDEFALDLEGAPAQSRGLIVVGHEIKRRIKRRVGEWLTVSIGIGPNRFLAKTAAGLHKPDGLDVISEANYQAVYEKLQLVDLCGIDKRNAARLNSVGVFTVRDFYHARPQQLKAAFQSVLSHYWYCRLRGWEIDDVEFGRKSFGNSYSLPEPKTTPEELAPLLCKLVEKMSFRLRKAGYVASGIYLAMLYRDGSFWHQSLTVPRVLFAARDIYRDAYMLLWQAPYRKPVRNLAVSCFNLTPAQNLQLTLLDDEDKKARLAKAVDAINVRFGDYTITPARMIGTEGNIPDRISFGGIKELEQFITQ
jgi:DNA polymerase-4